MNSTRAMSLLSLVGLVLASCGGSSAPKVSATGAPAATTAAGAAATTAVRGSGSVENAIVAGRVTDVALAAVVSEDDRTDPLAVQSIIDQLAQLPAAEQDAVRADLAVRVEQDIAALSGLEAAVGDASATLGALRGAWAQIAVQLPRPGVAIPLAPAPRPGRSRSAADQATTGESAGFVNTIGVTLGMTALSLAADPIVSLGNELAPDAYAEGRTPSGALVSAAIEQSTVEMEFGGTQDGVDVAYKASAVVHPCPKPDGTFDAQLKLEVRTTKGSTGASVAIDLDLTGSVDDDANLVGWSSSARAQVSRSEAGSGQFLDATLTRTDREIKGLDVRRLGGTITREFRGRFVLLVGMFSDFAVKQYVEAAQKAWQSGRCVQLDLTASPGPSGLKPSSTATISARPRSKIDGAPTGGTVTARLTDGGKSVEPTGTKVRADAEFTYSAPDEKDRTGTVAVESRSKRGVGKAELTLDTKSKYAYRIVGGLDDFQTDTAVCDILAPFTLTSSVGNVTFSGGLSGTYSYTGIFAASGTGTYTIDLPEGPGRPGTMTGQGEGSAAGNTAFGVERYTLTPLPNCAG